MTDLKNHFYLPDIYILFHLDNPNYFCGSGNKMETKPSEDNSRGFFLFRRKSATMKHSKKEEKSETSSGSTNKRGSLRSLLRSKSGSSATMVWGHNL